MIFHCELLGELESLYSCQSFLWTVRNQYPVAIELQPMMQAQQLEELARRLRRIAPAHLPLTHSSDRYTHQLAKLQLAHLEPLAALTDHQAEFRGIGFKVGIRLASRSLHLSSISIAELFVNKKASGARDVRRTGPEGRSGK